MIRWASWWLVAFLAYLAFVASDAHDELVLGSAAAVAGASAIVLAHRADHRQFSVEPRYVGRMLRHVPSSLVIESALLLGPHLWATLRGRGRPGRFLRLQFVHGGDDGRDAGRRALFLYTAALTPNTIPLFLDRDTNQAVVHQLVRRREPHTDDVFFPA